MAAPVPDSMAGLTDGPFLRNFSGLAAAELPTVYALSSAAVRAIGRIIFVLGAVVGFCHTFPADDRPPESATACCAVALLDLCATMAAFARRTPFHQPFFSLA